MSDVTVSVLDPSVELRLHRLTGAFPAGYRRRAMLGGSRRAGPVGRKELASPSRVAAVPSAPWEPDSPIVDQVPPEPEPEPTPGPTPGPGPGDDAADETTVANPLPELGAMTARVTQDPDAGFEVLLTAPDGTTSVSSSEPRARKGLVPTVVLDAEGRAVTATAVGDLVR